jgi:hypothetical protein
MGQLFPDVDGFSSLPPVTQLQCLMNVIARTQRDLARFHHEVKQILAAHPRLDRYLREGFKKPAHLVVHNAPPRRSKIVRYRPRQRFEDDGLDAT